MHDEFVESALFPKRIERRDLIERVDLADEQWDEIL